MEETGYAKPRNNRKYSDTYQTWTQMHARCCSNAPSKKPLYKDLNITVDPRWDCYEGFYKDMGDKPDGLVLGRIDKTKGFSPENCRWMTNGEAHHNARIIKPVGRPKKEPQAVQQLLPLDKPQEQPESMASYTEKLRKALKEEGEDALKRFESARKRLQILEALDR